MYSEATATESNLITTDVGWSYNEIYQDYDYGCGYKEPYAEYADLRRYGDIANLFLRSVYVEVTDAVMHEFPETGGKRTTPYYILGRVLQIDEGRIPLFQKEAEKVNNAVPKAENQHTNRNITRKNHDIILTNFPVCDKMYTVIFYLWRQALPLNL